MLPRLALLAAAAGALCACALVPRGAPSAPAPGSERLTLDDVLQLPPRLRLDTALVGWRDDSAGFFALQTDPASGTQRLHQLEAASGATRPAFDPGDLAQAFEGLPGVEPASAQRWSRRTHFDWTADRTGVLLNESNDLFFWRLGAAAAVRVTRDARDEVGETLSPDGRWVGYVSDWNLHVAPTDGSSAPRALTTQGSEELLHGRLDWVYQEELYGRGNFGAFWWSPDSSQIAYLVIDERRVPTYVVSDHRTVHPLNEVWRYPKAGDPNPVATLHVVDVASGVSSAVDLAAWAKDEPLIVRVSWTPDSRKVVFQVQNRVQTWLDLVEADPRSGATRTLFRDSTAVWIEPHDGPYWIEGGARFLWRSERDGFAHLYLYQRDGQLVGRLTEGAWEVDRFLRYDEGTQTAWFLADRDDVKGAQLYRCKLDGSALERVTRDAGTHSISFSPDGAWYLDTFSSAREWPRLSLHRADGTLVRELERVDATPALKKGVVPPEFVKFATRDGFELEGALLKPPGFDARKRYPVIVSIYSGPHAPKVLDRPLNTDGLFHAMLAQEGYLVWSCDNRSASGKGLASAAGVYRNLGTQELADIEDGLDWLIAQGFADPERIALWGWSYGGYQTAFALTHSTRFKCGVIGAPVTDWRLYDSIYTERYMGLPGENSAGYQASSVLEAAAALHGRALILHGVIDENVHLQNSLQLAERLQQAGKLFDLMLYPGNRHGISDPNQNRHKYLTMAAFFRANL